jgi:hypothetical protein
LVVHRRQRRSAVAVLDANNLSPRLTGKRRVTATCSWSTELAILCRAPYPNALLVGSAPAVAGIIATVVAHCRRPIAHWAAETVETSAASGTVVLWRIETLNARHQRHLLDVLNDRPGALQFLSVAASDPFALVRQGVFLDALYYRLSVVRITPEVIQAACWSAGLSQAGSERRSQH